MYFGGLKLIVRGVVYGDILPSCRGAPWMGDPRITLGKHPYCCQLSLVKSFLLLSLVKSGQLGDTRS